MGSLFDSIQRNMFNTTTSVFGYDASWTPSVGGATQTGKVLLKEPTDKDKINGVEYAPFIRFVEYREGVFDGLIEVARESATLETIIVDGRELYVKEVTAHWDGKTFRAVCELKP